VIIFCDNGNIIKRPET